MFSFGPRMKVLLLLRSQMESSNAANLAGLACGIPAPSRL